MSKSCGDAECVCAGKSADEISKMFKRGGVAENALFLASKVPVTVDTVGEDINQAVILINQVQTGMAEIGAGATGKKMKETGHPYVPGTNYAQTLYMPIVSDDHCGTSETTYTRPEMFRHFANTTKLGCLVLAGDPKNFQRWAMHQQAKEEISKIAPGRLWAYVKPSMAAADAPGHIISVDAINATASSTVSNGKGVIAWASGNYYEGDLKNSKMHGIRRLLLGERDDVQGADGELRLQRAGHEDLRLRQEGEGRVEGRQVHPGAGVRRRRERVPGAVRVALASA